MQKLKDYFKSLFKHEKTEEEKEWDNRVGACILLGSNIYLRDDVNLKMQELQVIEMAINGLITDLQWLQDEEDKRLWQRDYNKLNLKLVTLQKELTEIKKELQ